MKATALPLLVLCAWILHFDFARALLLSNPWHSPAYDPKQSRSSFSSTKTDEAAVMKAVERIEALDSKYGVGVGAIRERVRLSAIVAQWENTQNTADVEEIDEDDCANGHAVEFAEEATRIEDDSPYFVARHGPLERVAIFGGDPRKRQSAVAKRLSPYQSLDQYGTPRDVGKSDTERLIHRIRNKRYDVVYIWTRFNCHKSRGIIREACGLVGTRVVEIASLSHIQQ